MRFRHSQRFAAMVITTTLALLCTATADESPPDPDNTMTVTGRLLDADDKPVAGGRVVLVAELWCRTERPLGSRLHPGFPVSFRVTGPFPTDGEGRFQATAPVGPARPAAAVFAHAVAEGRGHVTAKVANWTRTQDITIKLDREHVIRGRLIDTQGQPVPGATVRPIMFSTMGTTRETLIPTDPVPPYASPLFSAVTSDDKGRFLITGFGKSKVWLEFTHERFATQRAQPQPFPRAQVKDTQFSLVAARVVEGRVTYDNGGKPAAGARVVAQAGFNGVVQCLTDADGRYSLSPFPLDSFALTVFPPDGQPYCVHRKSLTFSHSARLEADVTLERGALVRGRVTEAPSGVPVAGALVVYRPHWRNNPYRNAELAFTTYNYDWVLESVHTAVSADTGVFAIAVPFGPGDLFVLGPTLDYVHVESSIGDLEFGHPSRVRVYPDALIPLDLKPGDNTREVTATLRRGVTLKARVQGQDGKPIKNFMVLSRSYMPVSIEHFQQMERNVLHARNGVFELPGCDPEKGGTAWLFDPDHALGLTVRFTGAEAAGPERTVQLEPCGSAKVRCVDRQGKPVSKADLSPCIVFSPGTFMAATALSPNDDKELEGDWGIWSNYHFKHSLEPPTDSQGYTTLFGLVPGATYWVTSWGPLGNFDRRKGGQKEEFRVQAGKTLTLPDFVTRK